MNSTAVQNHQSRQGKYEKKIRVAAREVGIHKTCTDLDLKEKISKDLKFALITLFPMRFYLEFSPDHEDVIKDIQDVVFNGGNLAEALPRGSGKTTIIIGAIIWAIANGYRRYVVAIAATQTDAAKLLSSIKIEFETNEMLNEIYPELCFYIRALEGQTQRAGGQLSNGNLTKITWKTERIVFPAFQTNDENMEFASQSVIEARGLTGGVRGLQHTTSIGEVLRPDFVFLDDPQTRESAMSIKQTQDREDTIDADIMGLAGLGKKIAALMACTVIKEDDLSERTLLKWKSKRVQLIYKFPDNTKIWKQYIELCKDNKQKSETEKQEIRNGFYTEHRKEMDAGAKVGWEQRITDGDLSALQTAYNLIATVGEIAFHSEYQNMPLKQNSDIYTITPALLMTRLNGLHRNQIPDKGHFKVRCVDINYYGLSWVEACFRNDYAGFVSDYGIWPDGDIVYSNDWEMNEETAIGEALKRYCDDMVMKGTNADIVGIDGNRFTTPVSKFLTQYGKSYPFKLIAMRGQGAKQYKPGRDADIIGKPKTRCHVKPVREMKSKDSIIKYDEVPFDSSFWHVTMQKGFLRSPGLKGSCSFYGDERVNHREMIEQICSQKLIDYYLRHDQYIYEWKTIGKNDLGDALTMCYVLANVIGCELDGVKIKSKRRKRSRAHVSDGRKRR
jgi:hypothetical protein